MSADGVKLRCELRQKVHSYHGTNAAGDAVTTNIKPLISLKEKKSTVRHLDRLKQPA